MFVEIPVSLLHTLNSKFVANLLVQSVITCADEDVKSQSDTSSPIDSVTDLMIGLTVTNITVGPGPAVNTTVGPGPAVNAAAGFTVQQTSTSASARWYVITVGCETGIFQGWYVL